MIIHYGKPQKILKTNNGHTTSSWARSNMEKSNQFAQNLAKVFTPHPRNNNDEEIEAYLDAPCQLSPPLKAFFHPQRNATL